MKHAYKIILLFIAIAFITACSKDESPSKAILGKWYLATDTIYFYNNGVQYQQTIYDDYNRHFYYQYNSDGSGIEVNDTIPGQVNFTYTLNGHSLDITFQAQYWNNETIYAGTTDNTITRFNSSALGYNYSFTNSGITQTHHLFFTR